MDERKNAQDSGNTFLLGVILGSLATLLLTTKKGRELLKEATEKGLEKFTELEHRLKKAQELDTVEEENDYVEPEVRPLPPIQTDVAEKVKIAKEIVPPKHSEESVVDAEEKKKLEKIEEKLAKPTISKKENAQPPKVQRSVKRLFRIKKR